MHINSLLVIYFVTALLFISTGCVFNSNSRSDIHEYEIEYDGSGADVSSCSISKSNVAKSCQVRKHENDTYNYWHAKLTITQVDINFDSDITGPLFVYYEVENFYQNHRRYVRSRSPYQLMGQVLSA